MTSSFKGFILLLFLFDAANSFAQAAPFNVTLEPVNIENLGGMHSFAFAQHQGKWLIVGGRLDGLHQRQPFAAFDVAGNNAQLFVVDPIAEQFWSASTSTLSSSIQEQLKSTNMEFHQEGDFLYIIGGYGFSESLGDHTTFNNLTAINVSETINAIMGNAPIDAFFRQLTDDVFQVTGGHLNQLEGTFYLVGGQKFIGRYNPMGPDSGPGFIQEYTDEIRPFELSDDGVNITITHQPPMNDAANLHRRDYNVTPQILPNGEEGLTAFSGVFQQDADIPFLNCVNINSEGYEVNNDFSQYYNHYHCANIPIYAEDANEMNTVFFGGIAQFYDNAGTLIQDDNVPFVNTIARVERTGDGVMAEYLLPTQMPSLLGAGSEFIPIESIPAYANGVLKLDELPEGPTLVGYIYGGINSTDANIFFVNDGNQSSASSQIFEVYLNKDPAGMHNLNEQSVGSLKPVVYPNPNQGYFMLDYTLTKSTDVKISIYNLEGKEIENFTFTNMAPGEHTYAKRIKRFSRSTAYILTIETSYEKATQQVIVE